MIRSAPKAGTIAVTILAGPLNYTGVNPKSTAPYRSPASSWRWVGTYSQLVADLAQQAVPARHVGIGLHADRR